jgi:hypothetical protein
LEDVLFEGLLGNLVLIERFEGVKVAVVFCFDKVDGTELTESDGLDVDKLVEEDLLVFFSLSLVGLHHLLFVIFFIILDDFFDLTSDAVHEVLC